MYIKKDDSQADLIVTGKRSGLPGNDDSKIEDLKTFFNTQLKSILESFGKVKVIGSDIVQYIGEHLPCDELFRRTKIPEFRYLSIIKNLSYQFNINTKDCSLTLGMSTDNLEIGKSFLLNSISFDITINYKNSLIISSIGGKAGLTIAGGQHPADIGISLEKEVLKLNISKFDAKACISAFCEKTLSMPDILKDFLGKGNNDGNPLNIELGRNLTDGTMELTVSAQKPFGPSLFSISKLYLNKTEEHGIATLLTCSSSYNNTTIMKDQIVHLDIFSDTFLISATVDFPDIDLGTFIGGVNVFLEQVIVVEKKGWNIFIDLANQTMKIVSPTFKDFLIINICETVKFGARDLTFKSDKFMKLDLTTLGGIFVAQSEIVHGKLHFSKDGQQINAGFEQSSIDEKLKLIIPYSSTGGIGVNISIDKLTLNINKINEDVKIWNFNTDETSIEFSGFPKPLDFLNDKETKGKISGSNTLFQLTLSEIAGLKFPCTIPVPLPDMQFMDMTSGGLKTDKKSPGDLQFIINSLMVNYSKQYGNSLEGNMSMALPGNINGLFGLINGKPLFDLFKTYSGDFGKLSSQEKIDAEFSFDISKKDGRLILMPKNSPFKKIKLDVDGDVTTLHKIDLGELGKYECTVPSIGYDPKLGGWVATGTFKIDTLPSGIPMGVVKKLFKRYKLDLINNFIPDLIPLATPDQCIGYVKNYINPFLMKEGLFSTFLDLLRPLENTIDLMMKDILTYDLPDAINYTLSYAKGCYDLKLNIVPPKSGKLGCIKMSLPCLGPSMFGPQPGIAVFELYSISWGSLYGIPYLNIDADLRFIDLGTMIISMTSPEGLSRFESWMKLKDLFIINPYLSPVPLFIDNFEFSFSGFDKMKIESQISLPKPGASIYDLASLVESLFVFFTSDRKLTSSMLPADTKLKLNIGKNCFRLPDFLSGATFGKTDTTTIDLTNAIISMLNWLKEFQFGDLVDAIPENYRVLATDALKIGGAGLMRATGGVISLDDAPAKIRNALPDIAKLNSSLFAYITSELGVNGGPALEAIVGMVVNLKKGSGIYSYISGNLSKVMDISLCGDLLFNVFRPYISSTGRCILNACKYKLLDCEYKLTDGTFEVQGILNCDFLEAVQDEVFDQVKNALFFDKIRDAVIDVAKRTATFETEKVEAAKAKAEFEKKTSDLVSAKTKLEKAKDILDSTQNALTIAKKTLDDVPSSCDRIPEKISRELCKRALPAALDDAKKVLEFAIASLSVAQGALNVAQKNLSDAQIKSDAAKVVFENAQIAQSVAQEDLKKALAVADELEKCIGSKIFNLVKGIESFILDFAGIDQIILTGVVGNTKLGFSFSLTVNVLGKSIALPDISINIQNPVVGTAKNIAEKAISLL